MKQPPGRGVNKSNRNSLQMEQRKPPNSQKLRESSKAKVLNFYDQPSTSHDDDNPANKSIEVDPNDGTEIIF